MVARLHPDYLVEIIDAITARLTWPQSDKRLRTKTSMHYLSRVTVPTIQNDKDGLSLTKALGAQTMAFGTHVTPM